MIKQLQLDDTIAIESIPNLDLYMDQVITLFEEKLGHTKRYEEDKLLTKTMINNYTKAKLLMPAVKKKYTKEHILLMILLYDLKQILMIGDIKTLFGTIIKDGQVNSELLAETYQLFTELKVEGAYQFQGEVEKIEESIASKIETIPIAEGIEVNQLISMIQVILLTEKANYYKRLAEKIMDEKLANKVSH
ncbi:MAG: DUF1836 domain-containing protein [Cellulosilyticum sp.]|nr:DUF1836 domain-containing protein [Cellulosilyticum sp.]